jgi:hypothetical protein
MAPITAQPELPMRHPEAPDSLCGQKASIPFPSSKYHPVRSTCPSSFMASLAAGIVAPSPSPWAFSRSSMIPNW